MDEQQETTSPTLYPPRRRWWRDIVLGLTLFVCGMLVGGAVSTKIIINRAATVRQEGIDTNKAITRLERVLELTPDQSNQVRRILKEGMKDLRHLREGVRPQVDETLKRVRAQVAELLNEAQQKKWDEHFETMRNRWFPSLPGTALPKRSKPVR